MIPSIPHHVPVPPAHRSTVSADALLPSADPAFVTGKATAPGQAAKALIAEAAANGAEPPASIQGKAASAIARGIDMEGFFASFMPAEEPPADEIPDAGTGDGEIAVPGDAADAATSQPDGEAISPPPPNDPAPVSLTGAGASSYEIAATLLESPPDPGIDAVI
jgi:hypothetical protein